MSLARKIGAITAVTLALLSAVYIYSVLSPRQNTDFSPGFSHQNFDTIGVGDSAEIVISRLGLPSDAWAYSQNGKMTILEQHKITSEEIGLFDHTILSYSRQRDPYEDYVCVQIYLKGTAVSKKLYEVSGD